MLDITITGGTVVTPSGASVMDVHIADGVVSAVTLPGTEGFEASRTIDATGKIVIPGGIEPHAHIGGPRQPERSGAEPVSKAAIFGGTTTVLDFATQVQGHDLLHAVDEAEERWKGHGYTDYAYHPIFGHRANETAIGQIPELVQSGIPSFKIFTTSIRPPSPQMEDRQTDFGRLGAIMEQVSSNGGMLLVHSEDDEMVHYNYERAEAEGKYEWWRMNDVHSRESEDVSFRRVTRLAELKSCPVYFVHVSAIEGIREVARARAAGMPVYGETLHNYATFSAANYREENGMKYHTYPSLKDEADGQALWQALVDGTLSTVATDLVSTTWEEKIRFKTVADVTGGHNGIETRVGIAYTEGVANRGMTLQQFVNITSANAARIFGMYPRKGAIAPGSDADITIIDPLINRKLTMDDLHLEDYSIWEGFDVAGWPTTTLLRGKVAVDGGKLLGSAGDGQFLKRSISSEITSNPV
ncbi:MAG: amidohydrolase family protein [Chloroflexi bacterium]|jgi:dihydropyrimidinase|nr:amidohydrolase family protein [Chloroflexota bacterium]